MENGGFSFVEQKCIWVIVKWFLKMLNKGHRLNKVCYVNRYLECGYKYLYGRLSHADNNLTNTWLMLWTQTSFISVTSYVLVPVLAAEYNCKKSSLDSYAKRSYATYSPLQEASSNCLKTCSLINITAYKQHTIFFLWANSPSTSASKYPFTSISPKTVI